MALQLKNSDKHKPVNSSLKSLLGSFNNSAVIKAFEIIDELTPLKADCGKLCGGACCKGGENDGMRLFPDEKTVFKTAKIFVDETDSADKIDKYRSNSSDNRCCDIVENSTDASELLCICSGKCNRELRPLACRIFPLFPLVLNNGTITVAADARAYRLCPLVKNVENIKFNKQFVTAVRKAGRALCKSAECYNFLKRNTEEILLYQKLYGINIKISKRL